MIYINKSDFCTHSVTERPEALANARKKSKKGVDKAVRFVILYTSRQKWGPVTKDRKKWQNVPAGTGSTGVVVLKRGTYRTLKIKQRQKRNPEKF